jgi:hypothetical protein
MRPWLRTAFAELVDDQSVAVGNQRLFIAFQHAVSEGAVAHELSAETQRSPDRQPTWKARL